MIGNDEDFDEDNDYSDFDDDSEDSSFYEHEEGYLGVEEHDEQHVPSIGSETDAHFRDTLLLVHGSIRNRVRHLRSAPVPYCTCLTLSQLRSFCTAVPLGPLANGSQCV